MNDEQLLKRTTHGFLWSVVERSGTQVSQFIISIFLARILSPELFGLTGMLTIFMAVGQSIVDSGFGSALIQKRDHTLVDECSVFYFNIVIGIVLAIVMYLCAPLIATFFRQPILTALARVLALNFIINSFGIVQTALLTKDVDFKTQTKISVISSVISGIIGIVCAYSGLGVWSLVIQSISGNLIRTMLVWFARPWRPKWLFDLRSLLSLFSFGSKLLMSGIIDTLYNNIIQILIGRMFSPASLAFYNRAHQLQQVPIQLISTSAKRVTYPIYAMIHEDKERLLGIFKKTLLSVTAITVPVMAMVYFTAEPVVLVLYTRKWAESIDYLKLLVFLGVLYPLHLVNLNVLLAQGHSDKYFGLELIKKAISISILLFTVQLGIRAMILGQIASSSMSYFFVNSYYTKKYLGYSGLQQVRDLLPTIGATLLASLVMYAMGALCGNGILGLLVIPTAGFAGYIAAAYLLKVEAVRTAVNAAYDRIRKVKHER